MKSFVINIKIIFNAIFLCMTGIANAADYTGANASSEPIVIKYVGGSVAEVVITPRASQAKISEQWTARSTARGFIITSPERSRMFIKPNIEVEYLRVNKHSSLFECKKGCGSTMPNLISMK